MLDGVSEDLIDLLSLITCLLRVYVLVTEGKGLR